MSDTDTRIYGRLVPNVCSVSPITTVMPSTSSALAAALWAATMCVVAGQPFALHLPGNAITDYAIRPDFEFPPTGGFTVEGFVNVPVDPGSSKYMFSYAVSGNDNCLVVRARVGDYTGYVHWAMTVDATTNAFTHYVDGVVNTAIGFGTTLCSRTGGTLVLGQEQDSLGGGFSATQVRLHTGERVCRCLRLAQLTHKNMPLAPIVFTALRVSRHPK
eukprot:m.244412 g.244412  ORF g.244412 m.244412 type:complete len:216 (-) comp26373_c1_seq13:9-656(-)